MRGERDERARAKVLEALGAGATVTAAARAAGVARQTPYQWADRGDTEMEGALAAAKARGRGTPVTEGEPARRAPAPRAKPNADESLALEALRTVAGESESDMCRCVAAKALLDHHRKAREAAAPKPGAGAPRPIPTHDEGGEDLGALITRIVG